MRWWSTVSMAVGLVVLMASSCAHHGEIRQGDRAMERDEPYAAVEHYREANEQRPGKERIERRLDEAEGELVEETLRRLRVAASVDDVGEALEALRRAVDVIDGEERRRQLREESRPLVLEAATALVEGEEYGQAIRLIEAQGNAFRAPQPELEERARQLRRQWSEGYRERAQQEADAGRYAAATLYAVVAQDISDDEQLWQLAGEYLEEADRRARWRIDIDIDGAGDDGRRHAIADELFGSELPRAIVDARQHSGATSPLILSIDEGEYGTETRQEQRSATYIEGYEEVRNPQYESLRRDERAVRSDLITARHRLRRAQRQYDDARWEWQRRRRVGQSVVTSRSRMNRARRLVQRRQRDVDRLVMRQRRIEGRLRGVEPYIERPIEAQHTWEVTVVEASLTIDVEAELEIGGQEWGQRERLSVDIRQQSRRHAAQPQIDLDARDEPTATRDELRRRGDAAIGEELSEWLVEVFEAQGLELEATDDRMADDELVDALARRVIGAPEQREPALEDRLQELVDTRRPAGLLIRFIREYDVQRSE